MQRRKCFGLAGFVAVFIQVAQALPADEFLPRVPTDDLVARALRASRGARERGRSLLLRLQAEAEQRQQQYEQEFYSVKSDNFSVSAIGKSLSEAILAQSETLRREIALQWLGKELPTGAEFTIIHVELSRTADVGRTLLAGPAHGVPGRHRIWLTVTRERALGTTLAHEITHVVTSARFPDGMPAWANEGIASRSDDIDRHRRRERLMAAMTRSGHFPSITSLLDAPHIAPTEEKLYTASTSLVEFLLSLGDEEQMLRFLDAGRQGGWNQALKLHYRIAGTTELQRRWQAWLNGSSSR